MSGQRILSNTKGMAIEQFKIANDQRPICYMEESGFYVTKTDRGVIVVDSAIMAVKGSVSAYGKWVDDPKFGPQFKAKRIFFEDQRAAMTAMLSGGFLHGIKQEKAHAMVQTLGDRIVEILDAASEDREVEWRGSSLPATFVVKMVKGIGPIVLAGILESWKLRKTMFKYAVIATMAGFTLRQFKKAMLAIGGDTLVQWINESPYKLTALEGFNWDFVDGIAQLQWEGKKKIEHNDPTRLCAAVREVISIYGSKGGHMAMPLEIALEEAIALCQPTVHLWTVVQPLLEQEAMIVFNNEGINYITTKELFEIEKETAIRLRGLMSAKFEGADGLFGIDVNKYSPFELSQEQADAIVMALYENVSIMTGGPGVGKTACTKVLLNVLDKHGITYTLCAPTGKAARRMQEATGRKAGTLHKTFHFGGNAESLYTDYLVVDEMSMVPSRMLLDILRLVRKGQRILFVGDPDQLPPIGPGEPLLQMIEGGIHTTTLKTIYRQAANSGIITAAHQVNSGVVPVTSEGHDFIVRYTNRTDLMLRTEKAVAWIKETHGMPLEDIAVLTLVNDDPDAGRKQMNLMFQEKYNPDGLPINHSPYRIGDRVMQIKNNYELGDEGIMNGQVGIVIGGTTDRDSLVSNDPFSDDEPAETPYLIVEFDGEIVNITKEQSEQIVLSYAMTVHKTQGSQFPAVVLALPYSKNMNLRQIVYTALTRAEKICVIIVDGSALERSVKNEVKLRRQCMLRGLLVAMSAQDEVVAR